MIKNPKITSFKEFYIDILFYYDTKIDIYLNQELHRKLKEKLNREIDQELSSVLFEVTNV
jgi:hypothetical protein